MKTTTNNIKTLVFRDFLEFKNNPKKFMFIFISMLFPVLSLFSRDALLSNKQCLATLMFIVGPIYICYETTLSQTVKYIKTGIYEQYFLNSGIKKYQIVLSKFAFNLLLSLISCFCSFVLILLLRKMGFSQPQFKFEFMIIIYVILSCYISSAIGIISATLMRSEKSFFLYVLLLILLFFAIFAVFNSIGRISILALVLYMVIVCFISTLIVASMYKSGRFINRDV